MSNALIGFVATIYVLVGISDLANKNYGMSLMWVGYALANLGIIVARTS